MPIRLRTRIPGPKARKIVAQNKKYSVVSTAVYPLTIRTGKGSYLQDIDGNRFLDFATNVASAPIGYNHPSHMRVLRHFAKEGVHKIAGQDFYCQEEAALSRKLVEITPPRLRRVFLSNSGAEAVENAIKFAYRKMGPLTGVSCYGAFHGRTLGALTFTFSKPVQKKNFPQLKVRRVRFCTVDSDPAVNQVEKAAKRGQTAFIMAEPVQGEGGYHFGSRKFLRNLQKRARAIGVPLILDEVQSGLGRTGKWWAFEHYGLTPDIITSAKALQVGATISTEALAPKEVGAVSTTWGGGHRIDMAIALATIETIQKEKLMLNAQKMGRFFIRRLKEIHGACVDHIHAAEGLGLMLRFKLCDYEVRNRMVQECFKRGLLVLPCGDRSVRIVPPLNISKTEAEEGLDILEKVALKLSGNRSGP